MSDPWTESFAAMAELNVKVKKATESITRWFGATGIVSQPFPL